MIKLLGAIFCIFGLGWLALGIAGAMSAQNVTDGAMLIANTLRDVVVPGFTLTGVGLLLAR